MAMMELPEALHISRQLDGMIVNKTIKGVIVEHSPHKLAWYYGDRSAYADLLIGMTVRRVNALGGLVEIEARSADVLLGEGVSIRLHASGEERPTKHQLLLEFDDGTALSSSVQMYGGMGAYPSGSLDNPYYLAAKRKPSPYSEGFTEEYFRSIASAPGADRLSMKALLATEQRIPGLGNGVLQDILFKAGLHPKRKVGTLDANGVGDLFRTLRSTLSSMAELGGRDTETDALGRHGRYLTVMSKNTVGKPCPECGTIIRKEAYMGGSVYYCERCQRL